METRAYTERSNARRAARAAGLDPDSSVITTEEGFEVCFPGRSKSEQEDEPSANDTTAASPVAINGNDVDPEASAAARKIAPAHDQVDSKPKTDDDAIPAFCRIPPEQRKASWARNPPKAAPVSASKEIATMAKVKSSKTDKKASRTSGSDKNATLMVMLKKGATVDALCKATDWLPHTLRARISHLNKPKSKGGEGLKIERERADGVTSYRIAT